MNKKHPVVCDYCYSHKKLYVFESIGEHHICTECLKEELEFLKDLEQ
jgi:hypothetical protein|uniref:ORF16 n=1 Tax=Nitrosopumilaceae spindle-shaped virus TaxID=3065433 RepID=A0AAT9J7G3_9VIRU